MKLQKRFISGAVGLAVASFAAPAFAAAVIKFDPDGPLGPTPQLSVMAFDWTQNSALAVGGNPSGGLAVGDSIQLLAHAKLAKLILEDGTAMTPPREITFVAGFPEIVTLATLTSSGFSFDALAGGANFFEIWVSGNDHNALAGTGYNNGTRIMYGVVTSAIGNYSGGLPLQKLDLFGSDNYPGVRTITGSGSTQLSGVMVDVDADYFELTPDQLSNLKVFFNTSTVTPYRQINPSAKFVADYAGLPVVEPPPAPSVTQNIGPVNGGLQNSGVDLNFLLQADANQSFEPGEEVEGSCRVTYGGNDKNGNIDFKKFGESCASNPDKTENCYTFGGQVGAPTANPSLGGPFGEHTHHQVSGPAGDFVFRAGSRSAPKTTRITATVCKDPGAIQPAAANASFKQIDFEGTGSFRTMSDTAKAYLEGKAGHPVNTDNVDDSPYYFRVDMVDTGEPGNKAKPQDKAECEAFFDADQNNPLATPDPLYLTLVPSGGDSCADLYQFYICKDENPCEAEDAIYAVRAYLTGGNIQMHKVIK